MRKSELSLGRGRRAQSQVKQNQFRTCNWCEMETHLLLDMWCDPAIQNELHNSLKIQPVFDRIAEQICANGYARTGMQCREKIKTLKKEFRYAQAVGRAQTNFRYWDRMESISLWQEQAFKLYSTHESRLHPPLMVLSCSPSPMATSSSTLSVQAMSGTSSSAVKQEVVDLVSDVDVTIGTDGEDTTPELVAEIHADVLIKNQPPSDNFYPSHHHHNNNNYHQQQQTQNQSSHRHHQHQPFRTAIKRSSSPQLHQQQQQPLYVNGIDQTRFEGIIESAVARVTAALCETQSRLLDFEEKRMRLEMEREALRHQESRAHEIELLNSVGQMFLQAIQMLHSSHNSNSQSSGESDRSTRDVPSSSQ